MLALVPGPDRVQASAMLDPMTRRLPAASNRRQEPFIILAALVLAVAIGLFAAGIGNAVSWFLATLLVSAMIWVLLSERRPIAGSPELLTDGRRSVRSYSRPIVTLGAASLTVGLTWLVIHGQPLPLLDFQTSALATALFCLVTIIVVLHLHSLRLLSFPSMFLWATFLFTCSSLIMYQSQGLDAFSRWQLVDLPSVLIAMPVVMLAFSSFLVGALLVPGRSLSERRGRPANSGASYDSAALRKVGIALYVITIATIALYTLSGSALSYAFEGGYAAFSGARKAGEQPTLVRATLSSLLPWSLLILAATSKTRQAHVRVLFLAIPVLAILFIAGDRGELLPLILLFVSASALLGLRTSWRQSLTVIGLVVLLLPAIGNLRKTATSDWSLDVFRKSLANEVQGRDTYQQGPLEAVLTSTGASYQTLMATIMTVPAVEGYRYGRDYLRPLLVAVPYSSENVFLGIDLGEEPSDWVKSILNDDRVAGPGYLQVAEAYLEFGAIGVVCLYVLLGWGLTRLWLYLATRRLDPRILALSLIVMAQTLVWVRNQSTGLLRALLWGVFLVYVAPAALQGIANLVARISPTGRGLPNDWPEPTPAGR